jgi:hypothetical protein
LILLFNRELITVSRNRFVAVTAEDGQLRNPGAGIEAAHHRNLDKMERIVQAAEDLEVRLGITTRWTEGSEEWKGAMEKLRKRDYHRALDHVEQLLVSRIFELLKMNLSHTGAPTFLPPFS